MNQISGNNSFKTYDLEKKEVNDQIQKLSKPAFFHKWAISKQGQFKQVNLLHWLIDRVKAFVANKPNLSSPVVLQKQFFHLIVKGCKLNAFTPESLEKIQSAANQLGIGKQTATRELINSLAQGAFSPETARAAEQNFLKKNEATLNELNSPVTDSTVPFLQENRGDDKVSKENSDEGFSDSGASENYEDQPTSGENREPTHQNPTELDKTNTDSKVTSTPIKLPIAAINQGTQKEPAVDESNVKHNSGSEDKVEDSLPVSYEVKKPHTYSKYLKGAALALSAIIGAVAYYHFSNKDPITTGESNSPESGKETTLVTHTAKQIIDPESTLEIATTDTKDDQRVVVDSNDGVHNGDIPQGVENPPQVGQDNAENTAISKEKNNGELPLDVKKGNQEKSEGTSAVKKVAGTIVTLALLEKLLEWFVGKKEWFVGKKQNNLNELNELNNLNNSEKKIEKVDFTQEAFNSIRVLINNDDVLNEGNEHDNKMTDEEHLFAILYQILGKREDCVLVAKGSKCSLPDDFHIDKLDDKIRYILIPLSVDNNTQNTGLAIDIVKKQYTYFNSSNTLNEENGDQILLPEDIKEEFALKGLKLHEYKEIPNESQTTQYDERWSCGYQVVENLIAYVKGEDGDRGLRGKALYAKYAPEFRNFANNHGLTQAARARRRLNHSHKLDLIHVLDGIIYAGNENSQKVVTLRDELNADASQDSRSRKDPLRNFYKKYISKYPHDILARLILHSAISGKMCLFFAKDTNQRSNDKWIKEIIQNFLSKTPDKLQELQLNLQTKTALKEAVILVCKQEGGHRLETLSRVLDEELKPTRSQTRPLKKFVERYMFSNRKDPIGLAVLEDAITGEIHSLFAKNVGDESEIKKISEAIKKLLTENTEKFDEWQRSLNLNLQTKTALKKAVDLVCQQDEGGGHPLGILSRALDEELKLRFQTTYSLENFVNRYKIINEWDKLGQAVLEDAILGEIHLQFAKDVNEESNIQGLSKAIKEFLTKNSEKFDAWQRSLNLNLQSKTALKEAVAYMCQQDGGHRLDILLGELDKELGPESILQKRPLKELANQYKVRHKRDKLGQAVLEGAISEEIQLQFAKDVDEESNIEEITDRIKKFVCDFA